MVFELRLPFLNPRTFERQKVICLNCEEEVTMKITRDWTTELCGGCGCTIWYPPRPDRAYGIRKFIPRKIYLENKAKFTEREKFINEMKNKGIPVKFPALQNSKIHRMLTHESEIEKGNYREKDNELLERAKGEIEKIDKEGKGYAKK